MKIGFDNGLYMEQQRQHIEKRIERVNGKLYLEFGGKLFDDYHAARVLPGFDVNGKIRLLQQLKDKVEIIFCVGADDIEKTKIRADLGITYDMDLLRLIDDITAWDIAVNSVVITKYTGQPAADGFLAKLSARGMRHYVHRPIPGYPLDTGHIVSDAGYGANSYIETTKPLVVVTAPGPGSGKLATCLSQVYHEYRRGVKAGYAKFETFPIWNLPLKHPVNLAYEAATADLQDVNMIDPFHLEAYGVSTVNYNRDIEAFPIVKTIMDRIMGQENFYRSPTDMGVNMAGYAITDDEVVREASKQEIISRYYKTLCEQRQGKEPASTVEKIKVIMSQLDIAPEDRPTVLPAAQKSLSSGQPAVALSIEGYPVITGRASDLMSASSAAVLNAIKMLSGIDDRITLISPVILEPILRLKIESLGSRASYLKLDDVLLALAISAATNPTAALALEAVPKLRGADLHSTQMLRTGDSSTLLKLGIRFTSEPLYPGSDMYF